MLNKGLLKRLLPFFATFALGLLVASFFVTIAAPKFRFGNRWNKQREHRECRFTERQEWKEERRQKRYERRVRQNAEFNRDLNELVPPPPPIAPAPPAAPRPVQ
jgi:hypothetical protein